MSHSIYDADRRTHLKIVIIGLVSATVIAAVGIFSRVSALDLGNPPVLAAGQPTLVSGHLPTIR